MGGHSSPEQLKKDIRVYLVCRLLLEKKKILTVAMYYVHIASVPLTITIALIIASVKAFLVAGYFMHLISEKKTIYATLATTAFFFVALMGLTLWSMHDFPFFTKVHF